MSACLQDFRDDLFVNPHRTTCQSLDSQNSARGSHLSKKPVTEREGDTGDAYMVSVGFWKQLFTSAALCSLEFPG